MSKLDEILKYIDLKDVSPQQEMKDMSDWFDIALKACKTKTEHISKLHECIKELEANQIPGRCKECEHRFEHKTISRYFCDRLGVYVEDYEYCARFDKREE